MQGRRPGQGREIRVTPRPDIPIRTSVPAAGPTRRTYREPRDVTINQSAADQIRAIAIGKCIDGAKFLYANSFNNATDLYLVTGNGEGPISAIIPKLSGVAMTNDTGNHWTARNGLVQAWTYLGTQTAFQETASGLFALDPTWITDGSDGTHGYDYLVFTVFKFTFDQNFNPSVDEITFEYTGYADLYDPRDTTRKYSDCAAMAIREVLSNQRWGARIPSNSTYFDDTEFSTASSDCDAVVFPSAPTSAPSGAQGAAGNVLPGNYLYAATNLNANGVESTLGAPSSAVPVAGGAKQVNLTIPVGGTGTATRKVYRWDGSSLTAYRYVGTINDNVTTSFTDNLANNSANATPPKVMPATKRYPIGLLIAEQASLDDWLETLRGHCLGVLTQDNGRYQLRINKALPGGYAYQDFSENSNWDGAGAKPNVDPESILWYRNRRADLFNEVEVRFTDQQNNYTPGSVVKQRASVIAGTEMPRRAIYNLQGVPDSSVAARLATQLLNLAWDDAVFEFQTDRRAMSVQPWDVVRLTGAGVTQQKIRVRSSRSKGEGYLIRGTEYQDASFSDSIVQADSPISTGSSPLTTPSPYDQFLDICFLKKENGGSAPVINKWSFSAPQMRSSTKYGASNWSATNTSAFTASKVNDGDIANAAVVFNVGGAGTLVLDALYPIDFQECYIKGTGSGNNVQVSTTVVEYSDDGSSWTTVVDSSGFGGGRTLWTGANVTDQFLLQWHSVGSHRYWRLRIPTCGGDSWSEVQFYRWLGASPVIVAYNIYDTYSGTPVFYAQVSGAFTSTNPLLLDEIIHQTGGANTVQFLIKAVTNTGVESQGVAFRASFGLSFNNTTLTVGDTQTLSNKTLDDTNVIAVKDANLTIEDDTDSTKKLQFQASGITTGTTRTLTAPDANATIAGKDIDNAFSVLQTLAGGANVSNRDLEVNAYRLQQFHITIFNSSGTLQHRIISSLDNQSLGNYAGKISGASSTLTNTPSVDSTHGFTTGAGILASSTEYLVLDTAAQTVGEFVPLAVVAFESAGGAASSLRATCVFKSDNVNGTTRTRLCLRFSSGGGTLFNLNTTNIPSGAQISINVLGFVA